MAPHYRPIEQARASMNFPQQVPFDATNDHVAQTGGTDAVVSLIADTNVPGGPVCIKQIFASYSAAPAAGALLTIKDGSTVVFSQSCVGVGPFLFNFDPPKAITNGAIMLVTLKGGGGAVVAYLDVNAYYQS